MCEPAAATPWAASAILGGVLAALGYVGKLLTELGLRQHKALLQRRARLAELLALLRAGDAAFQVQRELRDRLAGGLWTRLPKLNQLPPGFDRLFAAAYPEMTADERTLHRLIRAYTTDTLKPLNDALLAWLQGDTHFRGLSARHKRYGALVLYLTRLEAHLLLWRAKFNAWIPESPDHSLVYLADEEAHGLGFPKGGSALVAAQLNHPARPVAGA